MKRKRVLSLFILAVLSIPVFAQSELVAKYRFENNLVNSVAPTIVGEALAQASGTVPTFEDNEERGGAVIHLYFGFNDAQSISYVKFANPLQGVDLEGATVSLWVKRLDSNVWDAIWSFFDEDNSDGVDGRFYLTPNAYVGFNGTGGWFDCNWPENVTSAIAVDAWNMVTVTADNNGFAVYINNSKVYDKNIYLAWNAIDGITSADFDYSHIINLLKSSANFYLGYGSWWGSAPLLIDDLSIYKGVLTGEGISALYDGDTNIQTTDYQIQKAVYDRHAKTISLQGFAEGGKVALYNISGQQVKTITGNSASASDLNKGIYIVKAGSFAQKIVVN
jgi:arabinan endo-1,5-alpha-L-arabinosidase